MKKHLKHVLLFALLLGCLAALFTFGSAATDDASSRREEVYFSNLQEYIDELPGVKVVDHAVYWLPKGSKGYIVISYFDSKETLDKATKISLKDEIDGIPVTSIRVGYENGAEWDTRPPEAKNVTSIRFPKGVLSLGRYTFTCLPNLTKYRIPASVVMLNGAFYMMKNLEAISIPASVTTIWESTFGACTNLKKVVFKGNVEQIGPYAFSGCKSLTKLVLPDSVESIGEGAFSTSGLRWFRVPAACRKIDEAAFSGCPLKYVTFKEVSHKKPVNVWGDAFRNCTALKKVTFPANAKSLTLNNDVFKGCTALRVVVNAQAVTSVGSGAFAGCAALESFTLSSRLNAVWPDSFLGCTGLKKVKILTKKAAAVAPDYTDDCFVTHLPQGCRVYVKTTDMARVCYDAGCPGKVIVKADLK